MQMLEIADLRKTYRDFTLGPIDLALEAGTAHGLIGPNGAGKSTLFRCIMGTVRRDAGLVRVAAREAHSAAGDWKNLIGYVGDYTPFFDHLSGAKNLALLSGYYEHWSEDTAATLTSRFGLDLRRAVKHYSTGQRTKLALIAALAHRPALLLLDEPATGLDPVVRGVFMEVLYECLQDEAFTMLYATHHVSEVERLVDELIVLDGGRILRRDSKDELAEHWRRITFRSERAIDAVPNQVAAARSGYDYDVVTSRHETAVCFLEEAGVESLRVTQLSIEEICVLVLKNRLKG